MEKYESPEVTQVLAEIARITSDGYIFMKMRVHVEAWEEMAYNGDEKAQGAIDLIKKFHRFCTVMENL